jgi:hypothetical protein
MNCAIHRIGSDQISFFVLNCVRRGNDFSGENIKLQGIKPVHWAVKWTEDAARPVLDSDGQTVGWDRKVSELAEAAGAVEIEPTSDADYRAALKIRSELAALTYSQVENYVAANVTDLASAKAYLVKLSKVVLGIIRMMDAERRPL